MYWIIPRHPLNSLNSIEFGEARGVGCGRMEEALKD